MKNIISKENASFLDNTAGVILANNQVYGFKSNPSLQENLGIIVEQHFQNIAVPDKFYNIPLLTYMAGIINQDGKDYVVLTQAGTRALQSLGLPNRAGISLNELLDENDVGYKGKVVSKGHQSVPYTLSNIGESVDSVAYSANEIPTESELFGSRAPLVSDKDAHNRVYAKKGSDTYDCCMSHFK